MTEITPQITLQNPELNSPELLPPAFQSSEFMRMKTEQQKRGIRFTALVSDFDNSYFKPNDIANTKKLETITHEYNIPTIIVTGNDAAGLIKKMEQNGLRKPEVIVGATGTEIWVLHKKPDGSEVYEPDGNFQKMLTEQGYDRLTVANNLQTMIKKWNEPSSPTRMHHVDFQHPEEEWKYMANPEEESQKPDHQPYKTSLYVYATDEERDRIAETIAEENPGVKMAFCEEIGYNNGLPPGERKKFCIDFLPLVPKAGAINYIKDATDIERSFNVGDSGNDISFMTSSVEPSDAGVIVGGAKPELSSRLLNATPLRLGDTGFVRTGEGESRKKYYDATGSNTVAAGSIIEAATKRLQLSLRFEKDPRMKSYLQEIIGKLQTPS